MKKQNKSIEVRIIGGKFRGRKINVPATEGLRPTHDRVRETLFNWLQPVIAGKTCLDAFSGTGALGFEALSRGAASVTFIESNPILLKALRTTAEALGVSDACHMIKARWPAVDDLETVFDLVFLDPPFKTALIEQTISQLEKCNNIASECLFYLEYPSDKLLKPPHSLVLTHSKKTQRLKYELYQKQTVGPKSIEKNGTE